MKARDLPPRNRLALDCRLSPVASPLPTAPMIVETVIAACVLRGTYSWKISRAQLSRPAILVWLQPCVQKLMGDVGQGFRFPLFLSIIPNEAITIIAVQKAEEHLQCFDKAHLRQIRQNQRKTLEGILGEGSILQETVATLMVALIPSKLDTASNKPFWSLS